MHLDAHDEQAGAREKVNHIAGAAGRKTEIVRLDEHQRALAGFARRVRNDIFQHSAVLVGMARPQFEFLPGFFRTGRGQHRRLKISNLPVVVRDDVTIGIADGFAHAPVGTEISNDGTNLPNRVLSPEQQGHYPASSSGLGVG